MRSNGLKGVSRFTEIIAAGLSASRMRANVSAANLANQESVDYKRRDIFQTAAPVPVTEGSFSSALDRHTLMKPSVLAVVEDQAPPNMLYRPEHPQADSKGYVALPNVNPVKEMTDMMSALRSYQAMVTARETGQDMAKAARGLLVSVG